MRECYPVDGGQIKKYVQDFLELISKANPRREQGQAQTLADLIEVGKRRGMKNPRGWARHVLAAREAKQQVPA